MTPIHSYTKYNYWANDQLLSAIERELNDEKLDAKIVSSFSSLRETVYHIWGAEHIWLQRLNGSSPSDWPGKNFKGTFSEAKEKILLNSKTFLEYVNSLSEEKLLSSFTYKNLEGKPFTNPIWESVHHIMNHSTYHRGQAVTIMRQLGVTSVPSTDFITYCRLK